MLIASLSTLAANLLEPRSPDHKDEWERGFDAGQEAAGRELRKILGEDK